MAIPAVLSARSTAHPAVPSSSGHLNPSPKVPHTISQNGCLISPLFSFKEFVTTCNILLSSFTYSFVCFSNCTQELPEGRGLWVSLMAIWVLSLELGIQEA